MSHPDDLGHKPSGVDERTQITEVMGPEGGSMWPGDWYVYENGRVDGPLSAVRAFSLSHEAEDGKPRLISRKGFSQWYPLGDLSEIFRLTDDMGRKVAMERQKANARPPCSIVRPSASARATSTVIPQTGSRHVRVGTTHSMAPSQAGAGAGCAGVGSRRSRRRRSSWALAATTMVETLMAIAPTAIGRSRPQGTNSPAAIGIAIML